MRSDAPEAVQQTMHYSEYGSSPQSRSSLHRFISEIKKILLFRFTMPRSRDGFPLATSRDFSSGIHTTAGGSREAHSGYYFLILRLLLRGLHFNNRISAASSKEFKLLCHRSVQFTRQ